MQELRRKLEKTWGWTKNGRNLPKGPTDPVTNRAAMMEAPAKSRIFQLLTDGNTRPASSLSIGPCAALDAGQAWLDQRLDNDHEAHRKVAAEAQVACSSVAGCRGDDRGRYQCPCSPAGSPSPQRGCHSAQPVRCPTAPVPAAAAAASRPLAQPQRRLRYRTIACPHPAHPLEVDQDPLIPLQQRQPLTTDD